MARSLAISGLDRLKRKTDRFMRRLDPLCDSPQTQECERLLSVMSDPSQSEDSIRSAIVSAADFNRMSGLSDVISYRLERQLGSLIRNTDPRSAYLAMGALGGLICGRKAEAIRGLWDKADVEGLSGFGEDAIDYCIHRCLRGSMDDFTFSSSLLSGIQGWNDDVLARLEKLKALDAKGEGEESLSEAAAMSYQNWQDWRLIILKSDRHLDPIHMRWGL